MDPAAAHADAALEVRSGINTDTDAGTVDDVGVDRDGEPQLPASVL